MEFIRKLLILQFANPFALIMREFRIPPNVLLAYPNTSLFFTASIVYIGILNPALLYFFICIWYSDTVAK